MKAVDVRALTPDQRDDELLKLKKEQFNLRFQVATGQLENTARVRQVRRDIARIMTIAVEGAVPPAVRKPSKPRVRKPAAVAEAAPPAEKPARAPRKRAAAKETKNPAAKKPRSRAKAKE